MPDTSQVVATFDKNSKEEVRVSIDEYHGKKLVHMRVFYRADDGEFRPGNKGLAISVDLYRALAGAIAAVGDELTKQGLLR